ncbi:hypothetical protein DXG01_011050 [Tephrocybe rancida]|nr:hypothetical protein DXG01_011050 [Tephrocybe rancida]
MQYAYDLHTCGYCWKTFGTESGLNYHGRTCKASKKRVGSALENLRDVWRTKRRRLDQSSAVTALASPPKVSMVSDLDREPTMVPIASGSEVRNCSEEAAIPRPLVQEVPVEQNALEHDNAMPDNDPLVTESNRRSGRKRKIPKRLRDYKPQCTLPLTFPRSPSPSPPPAAPSEDTLSERKAQFDPCERPLMDVISAIIKDLPVGTFTSPINVFGLYRTYRGKERPTHDPEESITLDDLDDIPRPNSPASFIAPSSSESPYFPYPNKTSFALGKWFWSPGTQISQQSFKELVQIVGANDFNPNDIAKTRWGAIDRILGQNDFDEETAQEWEDEDAGWRRTPIVLSVPFHKRMKNRGVQQRLVGHLYHRTIVSVIREKLANANDDRRFHYEPFELMWCRTPGLENYRVYGESYTSSAFILEH